MGTDPAAGKQQWIAFTNGINGAGIVAGLDLCNILRDIDFSRTGLGTGGQGFIGLVETQQSLGHGPDVDNVFGAGLSTGAATHAFALVHHRIAVGAHMNGVKIARTDTVPQSQAPNGADALTAVKGC